MNDSTLNFERFRVYVKLERGGSETYLNACLVSHHEINKK